jgi:mono/diheme cytochrome c family protein
MLIGGALTAFALVSGWRAGAVGQQSLRASTPSLVTQSMSGDDLFRFYCATCHGRDGKGDGPVAAALNRRPADLTTIAKRNGGRYPKDRLERFVAGDREATLAHGSSEMPVWGPIFQALDPRDTVNRVRIQNLVAFIESLQKP